MKKNNAEDYFRHKTYFGFLAARSKNGGLIRFVSDLYAKIKKYTLISAVIKAFAFFITLLEKSAVLLLLAGSFFLVLPFVMVIAFSIASVNFFLCLKVNKTVRPWICQADKITVIITKEHVFSNKNKKLFMRLAKAEAAEFTHPVIVVCKDGFLAAKWFSLNLLTVKTDYFFFLKRRYLRKSDAKICFVVL